MATRTVGGIAIGLGVRMAQWNRSFAAARKDLKDLQTNLGSTVRKIAGFAAGYVAVRRLASSFNETRMAIDSIAKTSDKLGIATENLTAMHHAARLSGVQVNQLEMGLQRMTRRVAEAAQGTGEAKKAIAELGLNARDLAKMAPDEQFMAIAKAMGAVSNQSDKVRLGFKLFDAEGVALINMFKDGSRGLREMYRDAYKMGAVFSRDAAGGVVEVNNQLTRLSALFESIKTQIVIQLSPAIAAMAKDFIDWATTGEPMAIKVANALEPVAVGVVQLAYAIGQAAKEAGKLYDAFANLVDLKLPQLDTSRVQAELKAGRKFTETEWKAMSDGLKGPAGEMESQVDRIRQAFAKIREDSRKAQEDLKVAAETPPSIGGFSGMLDIAKGFYQSHVELVEMAQNKVQEKWKQTTEVVKKSIEEQQQAERERLYAVQQMRQADFDFITGGLRDIVSASNASARQQFEINKALNIADTVMNTATAVMKYHSLGRPGMAITAGIIGAAQVAAIASTSFDGGGVGATAQSTAMPMETMTEPSRTVNINLGDSRGRFSRDEIMSIMDGVKEAVGDGVTFNLA